MTVGWFVIDLASRSDADCLGPRLRVADVEEIRAASGLAPAEALRRSYDLSTDVWAVREVGGPPIALWGCRADVADRGPGLPMAAGV